MPVSTSPFRDTRNRYLTKSLFVETRTDVCDPIFTLESKVDYDGLVSVYRLYMEADDPTEYVVAKRMLGDVQHWRALCEREFFIPYLEQWRDELQAKIKAESVEAIRRVANATSNGTVPAAKWVAEQDFLNLGKVGPKRGRPPKEKLLGGISASDLEEDAARIKDTL